MHFEFQLGRADVILGQQLQKITSLKKKNASIIANGGMQKIVTIIGSSRSENFIARENIKCGRLLI